MYDDRYSPQQAKLRKWIWCSDYGYLLNMCARLKNEIKVATSEPQKDGHILQQRDHKKRAKTFHTLLNKFQDGAVTLVFDCEKNLMLPKVEDQSTYYSPQLHLFNFTVVCMVPTKKLGKANVTSYVWTEDERLRGC